MRIPFLHDEMYAHGKRVLITGASGTFDRAITDAFVARGAHVVGLQPLVRT